MGEDSRGNAHLRRKMIIPSQVDVFPSERCDVCDRFLRNLFTMFAYGLNRCCQIRRVPSCNRCHEQVETACSVHLVLKRSITQFSQSAQEELTGQGMERLSFVETDENTPTERRVPKIL
jgi:hypothetical protein